MVDGSVGNPLPLIAAWLRLRPGRAGVGQAQIMAHLGHQTLTASARYMHANVEDKRQVVDRVFSS
ncbi:hypothetical protein [Thiorhodococcus mannitoliphagus]|uniref:hypothetical protein n=1 Tax=Thiorhodococcus mannitoliphagus TaxID=329406 RepID=UPI00198259F3|nr:hypothetical protein [Thiorhodococcus mannitoliphagus]